MSDGRRIVVHKEMGLVAQVFDEPSLTALRGDIAVGALPVLHHRFVGVGERAADVPVHPDISLALGHNGNLTNTRELPPCWPLTRRAAPNSGRPRTPMC